MFPKDFMWEGVEEGKKAHLVNWEIIGKPVHLRGLELGNLRGQNRAYWQNNYDVVPLSLLSCGQGLS